uniref:Peptidylprolyl isomerase n=1 Tax=Tetraselmis sp. GSL018 TaxID=582737 RepID=A0A061S3U6_9CHLO|eukprot:CAMPEP_0177606938 /NCGR_PEP_ID=MMETSP0419_2-20121207/17601_1 /TAXON_ID=582737 /ORGANISM="Tetraselmis sp., Strain GSL018" /LENGTH=916 /DNA_ID=CAMNT_0019101387 /DNA_START=190 /DNA_END=2940 /DNA_ORIENTATION=-
MVPGRPTLIAIITVLLATGSVVSVEDGRQVLFSIPFEKSVAGDAVPVPDFQLKEGDRISDAVSSYALAQGLSSQEESRLLNVVNEEAMALRLVPVKTLYLDILDEKVPVPIFEGDDIRHRIIQAASSRGVTEAKHVEELLETALVTLKRERVVPVLTLNVTVPPDEVVKFHLFEGESEQSAVDAFSVKYGLSAGQSKSLSEQVHARSIIAGLLPLLEVGVPWENDSLPTGKVLKLFQGDTIAGAVKRFAEQHGLSSDKKSELARHVNQRAMQSGVIPYAYVAVEIPATDSLPRRNESLAVRALENATEAVARFSEAHGLSQDDAHAILASVVRQGTDARVLPALEFPVFMASPSGDGAPQEQLFRLFQGDDLAGTVARFADEHALGSEHRPVLLQHATRLAHGARLMPLGVITVNVTSPAGELIPVELPVYKGDNVSGAMEAKARSMGFPDELVDSLRDAAVAEGRRNRLEPAMVFNVTVGAETHWIPTYVGDNVTAVAEEFAHAQGLSEAETEELLSSLSLLAMQRRLLPMLTVPVSITLQDTGNTTKYALEIFHGDNIEGSVDNFLEPLDLEAGERARARESLLAAATNAAHEKGILPIMKVDVEFGGSKETIGVFKGDTPEEAVARFVKRRGVPEDWSDDQAAQLAGAVSSRAVDMRMLPVMQLELQAGDRKVPLHLFKGDNISQRMDELGRELRLSPEDRAALETDVVSRAQARRLVPMMTIPVKLDGENEDQFHLFQGDSVKEAVADWAKARGLSEDDVAVLEQAATARATRERILPAMRVEIRIGGVPQELLLYSGDNITEAVQAFVERHGLTASDHEALGSHVSQRAVSERLLPEHVIPIEVQTDGDAPASTSDLLIFKGDEIEDKATRFLQDNKLSVDKEKFVRSVEKLIEHRRSGFGEVSGSSAQQL